MIVYKFRADGVYVGPVELPDGPTIPKYHTWTAPPEKDGFHAMMQNGWVLVEGPIPPEPEPVPPPPEPEPDYAALARAERNARLSASDWTQLADAPVDKIAWAAYRQALRDVPQQEGFPTSVVWPVEPVEAVVS